MADLAADSSPEAERELNAAVERLLAAHADAEVRGALSLASSREAHGRLWDVLCAASEGQGGRDEAVVARTFALPLVIVSGARQSATVGGALADVATLAEVLRRAGALGASRNLGFSNALCSLETLQRLPPSTVRDWSAPDAPGSSPRDVAPEPIAIRAGEEVHLRFLLGAAVTPAAAPPVHETAAHIGAWGLQFARALGAQIAVPGIELLALPRPPAGVLKAAYTGRRAQLEVALNLFMSNTIKRVRAAAGEPVVVVSVHEAGDRGGELRVSMSAPFDEAVLEGFRWPLHPIEEPNEIARMIGQFAADCRLTDVRIVDSIQPEGGAALFLRADAAPPHSGRH